MILVGEGVDGVGKSTACALLAKRLDAVLFATPPAMFLRKRSKIERLASNEEHYRFFLRGVKVASREIRELTRLGYTVVVDRYWMTTVAYHRALGLAACSRADFGKIVEPDATFYFEVAEEERQRRLTQRGLTEGDKRTQGSIKRVLEEYEHLLSESRNTFRINTAVPLEEVVERVVERLPRSSL